jgi:hypothetical protein
MEVRRPQGLWWLVALAALAGRTGAQEGAVFRARLSVVPVDAVTARTTSGTGSVTAALVGTRLFLAGRFEGLSSPATAAHLHRAPKGLRGPVAFALSIVRATAGGLGGSVELTSEQIDALKMGGFYVQIHSERNPDGELRGWLLPEEASP